MSFSAQENPEPLSQDPRSGRTRQEAVQTARIAISDLEGIVIRWCEARNVGQLSRVGPDGPGKTQTMHEGYAPTATWESDRVHAALCSIGRGAYFPSTLRDLLDHVYWRGHNAESFNLMQPGRGLPEEVIGLGIRSPKLIELGLKQFFKALRRAVEEQPRPEAVKEFEGG